MIGSADDAIGVGNSGIFRTGAGSEGGAKDGRFGILGRLYDGGGGRGTAVDPPRGLNFSRSAITDFLPDPELSASRLGVLELMTCGLLACVVEGTLVALLFVYLTGSGLSVVNVGALAAGGTVGGVETVGSNLEERN